MAVSGILTSNLNYATGVFGRDRRDPTARQCGIDQLASNDDIQDRALAVRLRSDHGAIELSMVLIIALLVVKEIELQKF